MSSSIQGYHNCQEQAYLYLLSVAEQMLTHAGVPSDVLGKYHALKTITLQKNTLSFSSSISQKETYVTHMDEGANEINAANESFSNCSDLVRFFSEYSDVLFSSLLTVNEKLNSLVSQSEPLHKLDTEICFRTDRDDNGAFLNSLAQEKQILLQQITNSSLEININGVQVAQFFDQKLINVENCAMMLERSMSKISENFQIHNLKRLQLQSNLSILQKNEMRHKLEKDIIKNKIQNSRDPVENNQRSTISSNSSEFDDENKKFIYELKKKIDEMSDEFNQERDQILRENQHRIRGLNQEIIDKNSKYQQLLSQTEQLRQCLKLLSEKYNESYNSFYLKNQCSMQQNDSLADNKSILHYIYFALYLIQQFQTDNAWLLDKLTDFSKVNEQLQQQVKKYTNKIGQQFESEIDSTYMQMQNQLENSTHQQRNTFNYENC